jgi:hypothetical protein
MASVASIVVVDLARPQDARGLDIWTRMRIGVQLRADRKETTMGNGGGTASDLGRLGALLDNPFFRKTFSANPAGALAAENIDSKAIPEEVLHALADLSLQELQALSRVKQALKAAGVSPGLVAQMV